MSERAKLSFVALVEGDVESMAAFARELVDGAGVFADENGVEVEIQESNLAKLDWNGQDELECAICETSLLGKTITTLPGLRLVCASCAEKEGVEA